jgi:serine/threonine protein kinase
MPETQEAPRYREISRLGAGGMATVTLAEDTLLGRSVALKRLHGAGDQHGMLRLKREALVGASLNHPNLVSVFDAQTQEDGDVVIVMEYVEGETLAQVVRSRGALAPNDALRILSGLAAALDAIHEQGIVHRDVKPANVLLGREGAVKLADLGVADVADRTRITTSGAVVGSFSYMAPEQLEGGSPNPAMDVYALAAVAYELLSGEKARPESNPLALAHAIATQPPPDLRNTRPDTPAVAAAVLQRGMSADPTRRPRSAGELVARLQGAFEPSPTQAGAKVEPAQRVPAPVPPPPANGRAPARPRVLEPASGRRRTSRLLPALLLLAAAVIAAVIIVALSSGGKSASHQPASSASTGTTRHATSSTTRSTPNTSGTSSAASSQTSTPAAATPPASGTNGAASGAAPAGGGPVPAAGGPAPAPGASGAGSPSAAVQSFYEDAAAHQFSAAWALADPNLRGELGGYSSFENQMSAVRSITFHRAQVLNAGANSATVAVQTTSVQTDRTQQCSGTARTVKNGAGWLLDGISINC